MRVQIWSLALALLFAPAAKGNELYQSPREPSFFSEVRAGVLYHEDSRLRRLLFNQNKPREDGIIDINAEVFFSRPQWQFDNRFVNFLLTPRPRIGTSINTGSGTSQVSAGFAWDYYITKDIFLEGTLDIAFHNGHTGPIPNFAQRPLGCNPLARQSVSLGKDIDAHWRVMITLEHLDNFDLCDQNAGLSNLGIRVGYRF